MPEASVHVCELSWRQHNLTDAGFQVLSFQGLGHISSTVPSFVWRPECDLTLTPALPVLGPDIVGSFCFLLSSIWSVFLFRGLSSNWYVSHCLRFSMNSDALARHEPSACIPGLVSHWGSARLDADLRQVHVTLLPQNEGVVEPPVQAVAETEMMFNRSVDGVQDTVALMERSACCSFNINHRLLTWY